MIAARNFTELDTSGSAGTYLPSYIACPTEPILFNQRPGLELLELFVVIEARTPVDEQSSTNILR